MRFDRDSQKHPFVRNGVQTSEVARVLPLVPIVLELVTSGEGLISVPLGAPRFPSRTCSGGQYWPNICEVLRRFVGEAVERVAGL